MWFFDSKNAMAVCVYCAIMEFSEAYLLLMNFNDIPKPESTLYDLYGYTSILLGIIWVVAAVVFWKREGLSKIHAFGFFTGVFGVTILIESWEPVCNIFMDGWVWENIFTVLEIMACILLIAVSVLIHMHNLRIISKVRLFFAGVLLAIITGRLIVFFGMTFDIGDYIDGVSTILVVSFTLISLFDEDIKKALDGVGAKRGNARPADD